MITVEGTIPFPPGTNAQALIAFGASCTQLAQALKGASSQVHAATSAAGSSWTGAASTSFVSHMNSRSAGLTSNATAIARIQPIVAAYAKAMLAAEAEYNAAVIAQQAAMAALPFSAPAEAAAITAEATAVIALETAGFACAAALATVIAQLGLQELMAFDPSLVSDLEQQIGNVVTGATKAVGPVAALAMPTSATATATTSTSTPPVPAPTSLAGALGLVSAAYNQKPGTIGLVKAADGKWLVALPGIEGMSPSTNPQNLIDAGQQVATGTSAYEAGVKQALIAAGAQPGDSVMFVAHSQGGLTAVDLANDPSFTSQYHVTNILTAGSPIGDLKVPNGTNLLSVENTDDLVTHIDNTSASTTHPTVSFTDEEGGITQNHDVNNVYLKEFGSPDFSANPQVQSFATSASGYLSPASAGTAAPTLQFFTLSSAGSPTPVGSVLPPVVVLPPALTLMPSLVP